MRGNEKLAKSPSGAPSGERQSGAWSYRRSSAVAIGLVGAALTLAACGSGSAAPHVASLGSTTTTTTAAARAQGGNSDASPTTTRPKGDATALLDEWATCMRSHGDPNQPDPTIDANGVIHITWNPAIPGGYLGTNHGGQGNLGPGQYCRQYLSQAQAALDGGEAPKLPTQAQLVAFAECMRANGISDFPDPTNGNLSINRAAGGDLNPDDPVFQRASRVCVKKTGAHVPGAGSPPPGTIEINGATPPGISGSGADLGAVVGG